MLRIHPRQLLPAALIAGLSLVTIEAIAAPRADFSDADDAVIRENWPEAIETPSGLRYVINTEGTGERPRSHQKVSVLYRGSLLDGTVFSQNLDETDPFKFTVGMGQVVLGWEEAILDMRVGEKRLLIIPYALGYGLRGSLPDIPNRATLLFELELLAFE